MSRQFTLKPITREGVDRALEKAKRYRLLNEAREAESICRDVLAVDSENQDALKMLLLAITDQFPHPGGLRRVDEARAACAQLPGEYEREYYAGVIAERHAKSLLGKHVVGHQVYEQLRAAMAHYETAERLSPPANDDAILRWNTCARVIMADERIAPDDAAPAPLAVTDEDMPLR